MLLLRQPRIEPFFDGSCRQSIEFLLLFIRQPCELNEAMARPVQGHFLCNVHVIVWIAHRGT